MKKFCTLLLSAMMLIMMIPSAVFADTPLEENYRILLSWPSCSYTGKPIETKFFVVDIETPEYMEYEDFLEGGQFYDLRDDYVLDESNYTWEYKDNTDIGEATVTVTGKGEYTGTLTKVFYINPSVNEKLKTTVNSDKSVTIEPVGPGLKAKDITLVEVWTGGVDAEEYVMTKGTEYKVASDGAVTITKKFLRGETGFRAWDGKIKIRVESKNYLGYAKMKFYNISSVQYWDNGPLVYNGKGQTPKVTLDGLKRGTDFKVVFAKSKSKRKEIGTYYYTVKGIGDCVGTKKGSFKIIPKKTTSVTLKKTKSKATVKWKKVKNCTGYQVQLIIPSDEESDMISYDIYKTKFVKNKDAVSTVFKSVKKKKYTRARVRAYKLVKGQKYYSKWKYD